MMIKEKWLDPSNSRGYKHRKTIMVRGGPVADTWK